jgi:hypothetical protein
LFFGEAGKYFRQRLSLRSYSQPNVRHVNVRSRPDGNSYLKGKLHAQGFTCTLSLCLPIVRNIITSAGLTPMASLY